MEVVATWAETWENPELQNSLAPAQRRAIAKLADDLIANWSASGVVVSVDGLYMFFSGILLQEETASTAGLGPLLSRLTGQSTGTTSATIVKLAVALLAHRLLNGELEVAS